MACNPLRSRLLVPILGLLAGGLPLGQAAAQGLSTTEPVGVLTIPLAAQSDTRVAIPLLRLTRFAGALQSVAGNVLTVAGAPNWTANQFAFAPQAGQHDTFFILFGANPANAATGSPTPKEGGFYPVVANGANTLTADLGGDDLSAVQPGTRVTLIPYWTVGTAFPAADAGKSFVPSASPTQRATTVLPASARNVVPGDPGEFRADPTAAYYFYAGAWRRGDLDPGVVCDDDMLYPDAHFIVRNPDATALTFQPVGVVLTAKFTVPVPTPTASPGVPLDFPVGLPRPLAVSLNDLGLTSSGTIAPADASPNSPDSVFVFDNAAAGYDKAPVATYSFAQGAWRKVGAPSAQDFGADVVPAGAGFTLHKGAGDGATLFWLNSPNYLNE